MSPDTNREEAYCPQGRYIHVPPSYPEEGWDKRRRTRFVSLETGRKCRTYCSASSPQYCPVVRRNRAVE